MFNSLGSFLGFLAGVLLTIGLLLSPNLIPGRIGYGTGLAWPPHVLLLVFLGGFIVLAGTLAVAGRMIKGAERWKEPRVIFAALLIAFNANALYVCLVDLFALEGGMRALVAVLGVPVIYGNLAAVLGKTTLKAAMLNLFTGALTTMGAGFIIAALIKGW